MFEFLIEEVRCCVMASIFEGGGSRYDKAGRQDAFLRKATGSFSRDKKMLRRKSWDKHGHADDPSSVFSLTKDGAEPSHPRNVQIFLKRHGATIDAKRNKRKVAGPSGKLPG